MLVYCAVVLMAAGLLFARPVLALFGASPAAMQYALPYMTIYLLGTLPAMLTTGLNPFVNAQGYVTIGMTSVVIGAAANLVLDPIFIFALGMGVAGAAVATVLSQVLSAGVRAVLSVYQSGVPSPSPAAARAGGQLCLPARYPKLGHSRFHHAADQQRRHDLLQ